MYVKFRRIFHRLSRKRLATILFENIPNIIIYCICFYYFFSFTIILIQRFLQYETTVLIRYESQYRAKFPAFTICGCCAHNIVCSVSSDQAIQHELATFERHSILDVLDNVSFPEHNLVLSCKFIYDSRRPEQWKPCTNSGNVIPSLHDGRKCLTYLSMLQEVRVETEENIQKTIDQSYGTTSYIQMEVNFSESRGLQLKQLLTALEDANVILSLHSWGMIPTILDNEFFRLEPGQRYDIHFSKQVTKLLEPPYNTNCRKYDPIKSIYLSSIIVLIFLFIFNRTKISK